MTELYEFQKLGAEWLADRHSAYNGDEPGLGKTAQAVTAADHVHAMDILVICPAIARAVWPAEFRKFSKVPRKIRQLGADDTHEEGTVSIVSYALFSTSKPVAVNLLDYVYDLLILDEAHYLKSWTSARTKAILRSKLIGLCNRVYCLSGTPTTNHNGDLYPILRTVFPDTVIEPNGKILGRMQFEDRYCKVKQKRIRVGTQTRSVRVIEGSKNTAQLRERIKAHVIRRKNKEVFKDMPPLRMVNTPLPKPDNLGQVMAFNELTRHFDMSRPDALEQLKKSDIHLATHRRLLGQLKTQVVTNWVIEQLEGGTDKLVLFFVHPRDVGQVYLDRLQEYSPVYIDGGTPHKQREQAIENFQNNPKHRVFLGQLAACSTAVTLTAATVAAFAETDWVPATAIQAAKRIHRIGQKHSCLVHVLSLADSIDDRINHVMVRKMRDFLELFG